MFWVRERHFLTIVIHTYLKERQPSKLASFVLRPALKRTCSLCRHLILTSSPLPPQNSTVQVKNKITSSCGLHRNLQPKWRSDNWDAKKRADRVKCVWVCVIRHQYQTLYLQCPVFSFTNTRGNLCQRNTSTECLGLLSLKSRPLESWQTKFRVRVSSCLL